MKTGIKVLLVVIAIILSIVFLVFLLSFFLSTFQSCTVKQSQKNGVTYTQRIEKIVKPYGYKMENDTDNYDCIIGLKITVNQSQMIDIELTNSVEGKNREQVCITYSNNDKDPNSHFDIEFFVKLVNAISGRKIDVAQVQDYLNSPKAFNEPLSLDFIGNWRIEYWHCPDDANNYYTEQLTFFGLTEFGTKPNFRK